MYLEIKFLAFTITTEMCMEKKLWIGLASVSPVDARHEWLANKGAVVNILACAATEPAFIEMVKESCMRNGYYISDLEEVRIIRRDEVDSLEIRTREAAHKAVKNNTTEFSTFHTYDIGSLD